jgi:hypothetical protein
MKLELARLKPNNRSLSWAILVAVLVYLPLRGLFMTYSVHAGATERVSFLFQIIPELLLLVGLAASLLLKKIPRSRSWLITLSLALFGWGMITAFYHPNDLGQGWVGIRHDYIGLFALLLIWLDPPGKEASGRLIRLIEGGLWFLVGVAIVEFFWGPSLMQALGYEGHAIGKIAQVHSFTPAPIQLGSLLLVLAALVLRERRRYELVLLGLVGVMLGLTYGRSAWIGATVMGGGLFFYNLWKRRLDWRPIILGVGLVAGLLLGVARYQGNFADVLWHGQSTEQHEAASSQALKGYTTGELIFGGGIGTAGPASFRTDNPKIAESWYLQLIQEIGIVGLAIYLALFGLTLALLWRSGEQVLTWLGIGLLANAAFLHIWADNAYLNIIWWMVVGLVSLSPATAKKPVSS